MRILFAVLAVASVFGLTAPAPLAQTSGAAQPAQIGAVAQAEIKSVIERQLAKFREDDAAGAFAFASPKIRRMFQTPERFISMVARGYPQIYRSESANFVDIKKVRGQLVQRVMIRGPNGKVVMAAYAMVKVENSWRIDGCFILKSDQEV